MPPLHGKLPTLLSVQMRILLANSWRQKDSLTQWRKEEDEFFDAECGVVVSGESKQEDNEPRVAANKTLTETPDNNQPRRINHSAGSSVLKAMKATACMSLAAAAVSNGVSVQPEPISFHDAAEFTDDNILPEKPHFFDAEDYNLPPRPGKVMHLTLDYQTILKGEKGRQVCFTKSADVDEFLDNMSHKVITAAET